MTKQLDDQQQVQPATPPEPATAEENIMKAIVQTGYGPPERVLEPATVERPAVGDDDVLIRFGCEPPA